MVLMAVARKPPNVSSCLDQFAVKSDDAMKLSAFVAVFVSDWI